MSISNLPLYRCENCGHYLANPPMQDAPLNGACRRYPPTTFLVQVPSRLGGPPQMGQASQFPGVNANAICGEHKPRYLQTN